MKFVFEITEEEAIYIRDALIDRSIELRTGPRDVVINEQKFLNDPEISDRRKRNYNALRYFAAEINARIQKRQ
jgi:hypothetical protein